MANEVVKYRCPKCLESVSVTTMLKWRLHGPKDARCSTSGERVPIALVMEGPDSKSDEPVKGRDYDECPLCGRLPRLDADRAFKEHLSKKDGDETCKFSGRLKNGKPPSEIPGVTEYTKELAKASEPETAPCPQEGCNRVPNVIDGKFGPHMGEKWGETVCPMSNQLVTDTPVPRKPVPSASPTATTGTLFPSEILSGAEATANPLPAPPPARVETLSLPADESQAPDAPPGNGAANSTPEEKARLEFEALASAFPRNAPTQGSTPTDSAPPEPAVARADNTPAAFVDLRSDAASGEFCQYCNTELRGRHECYPRFVTADPHPDDAPFQIDWDRVGAFVKADEQPAALKTIGMDQKSLEIASQMKEIFFAYSNRMDRSVQETLGPSEIGTPCDRRLAMSVMHVPPVNPGMDGWASFVGTCIHAGLAEMFQWADANTGRFAVEVPLTFPSEVVPKGTSDLLDRVVCMVDDHKAMGRFSLDKLRTEGIKPLYRVQLNVYGYGQRLKGERVTHIALIAWPREQASLADLYVVVEPYDPEIAQGAIRRAEQIAVQTGVLKRQGLTQLEAAKTFEVADDCTFCPFFAKHDPQMERGCNGRK